MPVHLQVTVNALSSHLQSAVYTPPFSPHGPPQTSYVTHTTGQPYESTLISACLLAGKRHNFWNADNATDLTVVYTLTPALTSERFFQTLCGLAQDAGTLDNVNPLQLFVTFSHYDLQLAIMPKPVWLVISKVWVPVLQLYWHPYYTKYTG